jgi:UDP-glucose 6-dehydrogenase
VETKKTKNATISAMKIGFTGQGYIGKNYALDFERRGLNVVRYSKEEAYVGNKEKIASCDMVFIAVPTPTTQKGFDFSIVAEALKCVGNGQIAIIKSTLLPGTTEALQKKFPRIFIMHSPEFLREKTAEYDAAHPERNIIGMAKNTLEFRKKAELVISVLPKAPYLLICSAREAELIKYAGNCFLYTKVIYINLLFDLAKGLDCDWKVLAEALAHDPRIGKSHLNPIHQSGALGQESNDIKSGSRSKSIGSDGIVRSAGNVGSGGGFGRGAGGNCFIKDFAAFAHLYSQITNDQKGKKILSALEDKNIELLMASGKDISLLEGVYGSKRIRRKS